MVAFDWRAKCSRSLDCPVRLSGYSLQFVSDCVARAIGYDSERSQFAGTPSIFVLEQSSTGIDDELTNSKRI